MSKRLRQVVACQSPGRPKPPGGGEPPGGETSHDPGPPTAKQPGQDAYDRGRRLLDQGDPAGAARLFADAVSEAPDNHAYHHAHGVALWQSGARSESIDEYNEALRLSPDNPTYRLNLAKALHERGSGRGLISICAAGGLGVTAIMESADV